ncbi:hypothetical protein PybrP1_008346 [[Pythium] brassicae (nom. inval.)]|nr:hypothetical protein PybrP1_008346 [[Pythium] brassicae (nom. inval.)]
MENGDGPRISGWSCVMCTFENAASVQRCEICLTPHRHLPQPTTQALASSSSSNRSISSSTTSSSNPFKKPRSSTSPGFTAQKIQKPLVAVGSSNEQEALRLQKKIVQLRELGIDLPANDMIALLSRSCYSVPAAVNAYFERMAAGTAGPSAQDAATERRVTTAREFFESAAFAREPFRLLGSKVMSATLNRSGVSLAVGDRLVLQAENAAKKRLRPGSGSTGAASAASSLTAGVIRVATAQNSLVGRLDRDMETIFQPLMKEQLVVLGGVCHAAPASSQMFASFEVLVFVYVSAKAFEIFHEEHPQFHLSDALYTALEMLHIEATGSTTEPSDESANGFASPSEQEKESGLEALFSDVIGSGEDEDDAAHAAATALAAQLAPFLNGITLREHQRIAVRWMLARENQAASSSAKKSTTRDSSKSRAIVVEQVNPMWETRTFQRGASAYFVNRFEKVASLTPPQPPAPCLGGILADDMGMGKTVMMLALVAHQKHFGASRELSRGAGDSSPANPRAPRLRRDNSQRTLIVCPLSLLHQWKNEVAERFRANTLGVHVYYGDDRESSAVLFGNSDIVLTTYGVLSKEFEKTAGAGALLASAWQRVILDEAHSIKNRLTTYFKACAALRATHRALGRLKVILAPVLLRRTKHSRDKHGKNIVELPPKHMELVQLAFSEEERTFYQAVYDKSRAEFNGYVASGTATTSYVAIFALLLRLRQACNHPFLALGRNYEAAQASAAAGETSRTSRSSSGRPSGSASAASLFRPQSGESMASYYSRISAHLQQDLQPAGSVAAITASQERGRVTLADASSDGDNNNTNSDSRSRSSYGSAGLTRSYIASVLAQVEEGLESHECPVCLDPPVNGMLTPCAHVLCEQCLRDSVANDPESGCPVCRAFVDVSKVFVLPAPAPKAGEDDAHAGDDDDNEQDEDALGTASTATATSVGNVADDADELDSSEVGGVFLSAKLRQLLRDLMIIRRENEQSATKRKVVVFSQWTYMLEMVAKLLQARGFAHCLFHGSMDQETRERVLMRFAKEPALDVLVISLKAGGVGLNLTCASVVILLDPWWNPGVEDQAIDRVHRLGQEQDVIVKRYVVDATVEDMILQLQQRKAALAKHVLVAARSGDDKRSERLSLEDLKSFFR